MTIYESFKDYKSYKRHKGEFGIEIETESKKRYDVPTMAFWDGKGDGSLRDFGIEYVLKVPLSYKSVKEALEEFKNTTSHIKFIQDSVSTSVHVHINFLNETFITLGNFLTTYIFVENILMRYVGSDRLSNLFCLPICDAEENFHSIMNFVRYIGEKKWQNALAAIGAGDQVKYASLNIGALPRFGSLEIRTMRGVTDIDIIYQWVTILNRILEFSRTKLLPNEIIEGWGKLGIGILKEIFKDEYRVLKHPDEEELLQKNLYYATRIAYGVDWSKLDIEPEEYKKKITSLDELSKATFKSKFDALSAAQQRAILTLYERQKIGYFSKGGKKATLAQNPNLTTLDHNTWIQNAAAQLQAQGNNINFDDV